MILDNDQKFVKVQAYAEVPVLITMLDFCTLYHFITVQTKIPTYATQITFSVDHFSGFTTLKLTFRFSDFPISGKVSGKLWTPLRNYHFLCFNPKSVYFPSFKTCGGIHSCKILRLLRVTQGYPEYSFMLNPPLIILSAFHLLFQGAKPRVYPGLP